MTFIRGCHFHWTQAVMRHLKKISGLESEYDAGGQTHRFVRRILALPFLPASHIRPVFNELMGLATDERLQRLMAYIRDTWITSTVWPVESWCTHRRAFRTNNDLEGWHHRMNAKADKRKIGVYLLIELLHEEASLLPVQVRSAACAHSERI